MRNIEDHALAGFVLHLVMYLAMNVGLFGIWHLSGSGYPWFVWPMLAWGIAIVVHGLSLVIGPGSTAERHVRDAH